jgi:hypothetical protein
LIDRYSPNAKWCCRPKAALDRMAEQQTFGHAQNRVSATHFGFADEPLAFRFSG